MNKKNPYEGHKIYIAKPKHEITRLDVLSDTALIAWFRCNSCYSCKFRQEVIDNDPEMDIDRCSKMHDRPNIIDMVDYLGYTKE